MTDTTKTAAFVGVAAVLTVAAAFASIPRVASVEDFQDLGQPFFAEFTDPDAATSLEVFEVDPATAEPHPFKVMKRDGRWVIPSHNDYPADAKDRLAKTAAQVLGLKKDTIRSSRSADHAQLGVLDPAEAKSAAGAEGLGKRITIRDKSDRVLAEYILGKDVPGRAGQKFVRRPGQARTYGVNVQAEPSTNFADWIEPNLLDLTAADVRQVLFDNRKIDEDRRKLIPGEELTISRVADAAAWTTPGLSPKQEVNPEKAADMLRALADLKIVGVRPKPSGLAAFLAGDSDTLDSAAQLSLAANGFHVLKNGVLPAEGTVIVRCADGVTLNLAFGRVTFARGEALSAGKGESAADAQDKEKKEKAEGGAGVESRYLFVQVSFNPDLIEKPKAKPPAAPAPGELPANVFARPAAEAKAEADLARSEADAYKKKIEDGQARVDRLSRRFAPWYYLVPGDAYRTLLLDRAALVRVKPPEGSAPPGNPFGPGGMPPGFPPRGFPPSPHGQ